MSTLSFSDSESTGGDSGDTADTQLLSHDDMWMTDVIKELDEYMRDAPVNMYTKWLSVKSLTSVYYAGLKATQADLDQESRKLFLATEAIEQVQRSLDVVSAKLQEAEAERDALASLQKRVQDMVMREIDRWEMVDRSDEESE